jgi:hypothetical protein
MSRHGKLGTSQRWLDLCLGLPVAASEDLLKGALFGHSPFLTPETRVVRLSQMRLLTNALVRANVATIANYAGRRAEPGSRRYTTAFLSAASAIRKGNALP